MATLGTITDSGDGVIEVSSTCFTIEDTTTVELEDRFVSFDGDGNWSLSDGSLELGDGIWGNVVNVSDENLTVGFLGRTGAILSLVSVVGLKLLWFAFEVFHGVILPTSIATV